MYHSGGGRTGGKGKAAWRAPTTVEKMSYKKFKEAADRCDQNNCSETEQHFYFRVTAPAAGHFIFKELPFFKPKASIFIKVGSLATGRQCHARTPSQAKPRQAAPRLPPQTMRWRRCERSDELGWEAWAFAGGLGAVAREAPRGGGDTVSIQHGSFVRG